ncbi:MAG: glycosyltransferase family 4 protein [Chloroflexota bacterium]
MPAAAEPAPSSVTASGPAAPATHSPSPGWRPSVLLVHERYRQRAGEDAVFDAELELLRDMGHPVEALVVDNEGIRDERTIRQQIRLGLETVWSARAARRVARQLSERPADVVHVHNTFPLLSPSIYGAARSSGAAVIQTIHNYRPICPAATLFRDGRPCEDCVGRAVAWPSVVHGCYRDSRVQTLPIATMLATQRLTRQWRKIDVFIALTEFAASKLAEGGLPTDRIQVKANFVTPDPGPRSGRGDGFLFVGRLAPEKGIGTIIDAAPLLGAGIVVRVVGDGPEEDRLRAAATAHAALQPMGRLDRSAVLSELAACRALVFPSLWYEGLPMTLLEAFAVGVPVIAARIGAASALVEDGVTGLTFEPGDHAGMAAQLAWAQAHPDEMAAFGHAGRKRFEARYTADASHRRLLEIYSIALERAAGRAAAG